MACRRVQGHIYKQISQIFSLRNAQFLKKKMNIIMLDGILDYVAEGQNSY